MKLTAFLFLAACLQVSAKGYSQKVSFSGKNVSINAVFASIEKQTGLSFFFNYALIKDVKPVTLDVRDVSLEEALNVVLGEVGLDFYKTGKTIFIVRKSIAIGNASSAGVAGPPQYNIKGRVVNHLGESLPSATVVVRNGKKSVFTNEKGEFELKGIAAGSILDFTYLGYEKKTIAANNADFMVVELTLASNQLDEAQVIAYGQTTQRLSTSNITMVRGKDIETQPVNNPLLSLEGRVPGLFITQNNGLPGSAVGVLIQGKNSLNYGTDPLYVIDGVPYPSATLPSTNLGPLGTVYGSYGIGTPLSFINTADIESIEVLKDADATAIYGSRAANGAILITTKRGKAGKTKASFNLQNGWGAITRKLPLLNTQQYLEMRHEAFRNDGLRPRPSNYDINGAWDTTRYTDWQKVLIGGTAQYTNVSGSVSGGNTNTQYLFGGTYHRETPVFPGHFSDIKASMHFNIDAVSSNQKFKMQLTGSYLVDNNKLPIQDLTGTAITLPPDAPKLYNPDGTMNWQLTPSGSETWLNPLSYLYKKYQSKTYNLIGNSNLSYSILPGLDLRANLGYNSLRINEFASTSMLANSPSNQFAYGINGRNSQFTYSTIDSWIIEPQVTYAAILGDGKLDALAGATLQQNSSDGVQLNGIGYSSDALLGDIYSAATILASPTVHSIYNYAAVFARLNYLFKERYVINLAARRDGSSRFGSANQFHNFYSIGAAWIFRQEQENPGNFKFLSLGKIRGSYGTTGSDQIGDYQYMNLYQSVAVDVPYQGITGLAATGLPNPYLQWEETQKLQLGIELGFLKNRIFFQADIVDNHSSNQLDGLILPLITGFNYVTINKPAKIRNREIELSLRMLNIQKKEFTWSTNINFTLPQNKLLSYPGQIPGYLVVGQPLTITKAFHFMGTDPSTGLYQFQDSKGNPTQSPSFSTDNTTLINAGFPKYYGGFQNVVRYKRFQLDFLLQFVKKIAANYGFGARVPGRPINQPVYILNRWQKPGDIAAIQRFSSNLSLADSYSNAASYSDAAYSDGSYIRLKNIALSFELPDRALRLIHFQGMKIYLQGQNLFVITKYKGMDPETGSSALPPLKILTAGLQMDF